AAEEVGIGGGRITREVVDLAIVACGAPVPEAAQAAEILAAHDIHARVLDCYSIKPLDVAAVRAAAETCPLLITVEDHSPEGGLGDAVLDALADGPGHPRVIKLAVRSLPGSGTPEELRPAARIDAPA